MFSNWEQVKEVIIGVIWMERETALSHSTRVLFPLKFLSAFIKQIEKKP